MCVHGKITFMTTIKVTIRNKKGEIEQINCPPIYTDLESAAVSKEEEVSAVLSTIEGHKVEVLNIEREFKQLGGYI